MFFMDLGVIWGIWRVFVVKIEFLKSWASFWYGQTQFSLKNVVLGFLFLIKIAFWSICRKGVLLICKFSSNLVFPGGWRSQNEYGKPGDQYFIWKISLGLKKSVTGNSMLAQSNLALFPLVVSYFMSWRLVCPAALPARLPGWKSPGCTCLARLPGWARPVAARFLAASQWLIASYFD